MIASERRLHIMRSLTKKGIVNLKEIAKELSISEITVRRDFLMLEEQGKLKRVQGGAALEDVLNDAELTMNEKMAINHQAKSSVAKAAAKLVKDGDCVFLDGGTSVAAMADYLSGKTIKIVTYSELVIRKLMKPTAEIFFIGGKFLPYYSMNVGAQAQQMLQNLHFDIGFFGCSGVDFTQNAAYSTEMESCAMKQIALQNSAKSCLLVDSTKLQKRSFVQFANLTDFEVILSDRCDLDRQEIEIPENFATLKNDRK